MEAEEVKFKKLEAVFIGIIFNTPWVDPWTRGSEASKAAIELAKAAYDAGYRQARGTIVNANAGIGYPALPRMGIMTKAPNFQQWLKEVEEAIEV